MGSGSSQRLPEFTFGRPKGSFAKAKRSRCGEYVFELYTRSAEGRPLCIPCSSYVESHLDVLEGVQ